MDGPLDWKDANYNKRSQGVEVIKEIGVLSRLKAVSNEYYVPQSCCRLIIKVVHERNKLQKKQDKKIIEPVNKSLKKSGRAKMKAHI